MSDMDISLKNDYSWKNWSKNRKQWKNVMAKCSNKVLPFTDLYTVIAERDRDMISA